MSVGGGIPKRLGQLKRLVIVLIGAAVAAAILTAVLVATGLADLMPAVELNSIDTTVEPWFALYLVLFVHLAFAGTMYVFFATKIAKKAGQARDSWGGLPDPAKALIAGLPYALLATIAVVAIDLITQPLSMTTKLGVPIGH